MDLRRLGLVLGAFLALATAGPAVADDAVSVTLNPINDSGISGTAQLVARGNQTEVTISEPNEPAGASEPVHIHVGPCSNLNPQPTYPLRNVEGGKSDTVIKASLNELTTGQYVVNVHQSAAQIGTYVACGEIPLRGAPPSTIAWAAKASLLTPRSDLALVASGDKLYAIGGAAGGREFTPTVGEFDPARNAWTGRARMPTARSNLGAAAAGGKIYAVGGSTTGRDFLSTVEEYDPTANAWAVKANMPTPRSDLGVAAVNGKVYAIGGMTTGRKIVATVEVFDPAANSWTTAADMPTPRSDLGVAALNGKIYAIGGTSNGREYLATVEEYDPATNHWTPRTSMPTARSLLGLAAARNGRLYAVGGAAAGFEYVGTVEEYDPATNTWATKPDLPTPRSSLVAAGAANGKVYVAGGCCNGPDVLATVEEATITLAPAAPTAAPVATAAPASTTVPPTATVASAPVAAVATAPPAPTATTEAATAVPTPAVAPTATAVAASGSALPVVPIGAGVVLIGAGIAGGFVIARRKPGAAPPVSSAGATPPPVGTPPPAGPYATPNPAGPSWPMPAGGTPSWPTPVAPPSWPRPDPGASYPPASRTPSGDHPTVVAPGGATLDLSPFGYQVVGPPRQGGMASVFKAYQPALDRHVAIKVLSPHLATDPVFVQRFYEEARRTAKLEHPNIVPIYDVGQAPNGSLYIVMRFIEGMSLQELLAHEHPLAMGRALRVARQVAEALEYAHNRGIVHRDVKPSNVMVEAGDRATLMDFGIAKLVGDSNLTRQGVVVGTPKYLSPEQAAGEQADSRSDIYSLGIVLYEMLAGRAPFEAENPMALLHAHTMLTPPPPTDFNPQIPAALSQVVLKALAKEREQRYPTAAAFNAELQNAAAGPAQG